MSKSVRRVALAALSLGVLAYLATGLVVVRAGEAAVVRRFGRVTGRPWGPGLHVGLPAGFDRVSRVRTGEVRRLPVGLVGTPGPRDEPGAGEYLTGDLNLIRAQATVQYRVDDPVAFTLASAEVEPLLTRMAESSLSLALAGQGVDATLAGGRAGVARRAGDELARSARRFRLGVSVLGVSLTDARPPTEVAAEFAAAQSARSAHDRRVTEAKTSAATTATAAEARARARLEQAHASADRTVALAKGRAGRFLALWAEARKSRGLTVRRLYLDALRDLLPRVGRTLVLTPDEPLDLSLIGGVGGGAGR